MIVEKIKNVEVRDDGRTAKITVQGLSNIALIFDYAGIQELINTSIKAGAVMQTNDRLSRPKAGAFEPIRETIPVEKLEFLFHDTGAMDLLIESLDGRSVQVSLLPLWVDLLRDVLTEQPPTTS